MMRDTLGQNKASWDAMADTWFGTTALPTYGCLSPTEDELHLFPDISGKTVLDIGCGSGHSLCWCAGKGAKELWGLDLSTKQIENARQHLTQSGYSPKLYNMPMERECGLPKRYFDIVYSIYAIGWTTDLKATFHNIASYLKPGGVFIFSWDHPFMHCVDAAGEQLVITSSYTRDEVFSYIQRGQPVTVQNRRLSTYINELADAGFASIEMTWVQNFDSDHYNTNDYGWGSENWMKTVENVLKAGKKCGLEIDILYSNRWPAGIPLTMTTMHP